MIGSLVFIETDKGLNYLGSILDVFHKYGVDWVNIENEVLVRSNKLAIVDQIDDWLYEDKKHDLCMPDVYYVYEDDV